MNFAATSLFSGLPVRHFLRQINIETTDLDIQIALSLVYGSTAKSEEARKKSHLTHATTMDHQIRFALKDRMERTITKLALFCSKQLSKNFVAGLSVEIAQNDFISQTFFTKLNLKGLHIHTTLNPQNSELRLDLLTTTEKEILKTLQASEKNLTLILNYAKERVYTGDYSTAYAVLKQLTISERNDTAHHILGLCCNFFGNTAESEIHFRRLLASSVNLSKVKAAYVLSMLYLRLHPKDKQCLETAESLLSESHALIESNTMMKDYLFHSVFNRNGFALCLFRRGKVNEALSMLELGIKKLSQSDDGAKDLHQSVLIYNSVQCLKALNRYEDCEQLCKKLLDIDNLFPEYWLELSIVYLEQSKFQLALDSLKKAEKLDSFIPEIYSLRGYALLNQNEIKSAINNYKTAVSLSPQNLTYLSDLQYCVALQSETSLEKII